MMQTPDGHGRLELVRFPPAVARGRPPARAGQHPGIRHIAFVVDDIDAVVARLRGRGAKLVCELGRDENSYTLCYVRGPAGIIVGLAASGSADPRCRGSG